MKTFIAYREEDPISVVAAYIAWTRFGESAEYINTGEAFVLGTEAIQTNLLSKVWEQVYSIPIPEDLLQLETEFQVFSGEKSHQVCAFFSQFRPRINSDICSCFDAIESGLHLRYYAENYYRKDSLLFKWTSRNMKVDFKEIYKKGARMCREQESRF